MSLSPQLLTFLLAMTPIGELRCSIPIALTVYDLSVIEAYVWSVLGNIVPVIFLLLFLEPISKYLSQRLELFKKLFTWLF